MPRAGRVLKWGLVPDWSNDGKPGPINARAETVGGLPTFSNSFRNRRCIIPATGFYEWCAEGKKKVPHRFRLKSGEVMWPSPGCGSEWSGPKRGRELITCCVITTAANELVKPFHDRMPAILAPDDYETWFDARRP